MIEQKLFIGGRWQEGAGYQDVKNKYNAQVIGKVAVARPEDVDAAIKAAEKASRTMAKFPAHGRAAVLSKTASLLEQRKDEIARTIAAEAGKAIKYSRREVERAISICVYAAEEAKRIHGETLPLDAVPSGENYFGFWTRRPVGVVVAITPFNFPLNLVVHKVAPAIAAGNSMVLKPASSTPLTAGILCEILEEAGVPEGSVNLVQGPSNVVGELLVRDPRVAKISFTGSKVVGAYILAKAGIKKVTLELGNTSPVIIGADADLKFAAERCAVGAYYNSGQVCISVQRIYVDQQIYGKFMEHFVAATHKMVVGDPLDEKVDVGPMIDLHEAERIETWVNEAKHEGARIVTGGKREGSVYWPTVIAEAKPHMKVVAQEAFGPIAAVMPYQTFEEALAAANDTEYGLQASVFTNDIDRALTAVEALNFGGVIINDTTNFRADHMPYGGNRQSGIGREGVKFAIEEMTNIQMVAIRRKS